MDRETRAIHDRNFELCLLGDRQAVIVHKYCIGTCPDGREAWHICTSDANNYYDDAWYALGRREMDFERLAGRPSIASDDELSEVA